MAELIWTEPALSDLDAVADYIALDNPEAARGLVRNLRFRTVAMVDGFPAGAVEKVGFDELQRGKHHSQHDRHDPGRAG